MSTRNNPRFTRGATLSVLAAVVLSCMGVCRSASAQSAGPAEIYAELRRQFVGIESVDLGTRHARVRGDIQLDPSWTIETFRERAGKFADSVVQGDIEYRAKRTMFRVNMPDAYGFPMELAYDGVNRQLFMTQSKVLYVSEDEPNFWRLADSYDLTSPAFLRPYDFLFYSTGVKPTFDSMRSEEAWNTLSALSRFAGEEVINGHPCAVIEIEVPNHPTHGIDRSKVYFAKDKKYFPIRYEHYIGDDIYEIFEADGIARTYQPRRGPDEGYYFAARAVKREFDSMGSGRSVGGQLWEMPVERVRVNADIPDAFFTIARSEALHFEDHSSSD